MYRSLNSSRLEKLANKGMEPPAQRTRPGSCPGRYTGSPLRELIGSNCRDPWGLHESAGGGLSLRLHGIALALRGPPVSRGFQAKPALIERRHSSKQSPQPAAGGGISIC